MSYDHIKCLAKNNAFLPNFRSMFLIFATPHERLRKLTNTYEEEEGEEEEEEEEEEETLFVNGKVDTRYKSMYWQPRRLDCHIHNTQTNTGIK